MAVAEWLVGSLCTEHGLANIRGPTLLDTNFIGIGLTCDLEDNVCDMILM